MPLRARGEVFFVVYDSKVTAMNAPGGDVYRYVDHRTTSTVRFAKAFAPKRSGRLAGGVRKDVRQTSRDRVVGRARSTARHSKWVHEGTYGPIWARGARKDNMMRLPAYRMAPKRTILRPFVRGQDANPFLERALIASMGTSYPTPLGPANPFL